jgi:hypothetical protein
MNWNALRDVVVGGAAELPRLPALGPGKGQVAEGRRREDRAHTARLAE